MRHGFLKLFQSKSVDIAQPDVGACGGITELKRITALANTFGIEIVPHCWGTGIVLHVCITWGIWNLPKKWVLEHIMFFIFAIK